MSTLRAINPVTWWRSIRGGLTAGSVTLLLIGIVSMNIVWGYPWVGMFALCLSMGAVGLIANRIVRPRFWVAMDTPQWVTAGEPFGMEVRLENIRRIAVFESRVLLPSGVDRPRRWRVLAGLAVNGSAYLPIHFLGAGDVIRWRQTFHFRQRGWHPLPDVTVEGYFPFHLFRSVSVASPNRRIAVAPRAVDDPADIVGRQIEQAMRDLQHRLQSSAAGAGDLMNYVGSHEYRPGMPVRRWDFASWARLGKPIVREYSPPSVPTIRLLIDTADERGAGGSAGLERLLQLAATAVNILARGQCRLEFATTGPIDDEQPARWIGCEGRGDVAEIMMHLAGAEAVDAATCRAWLESIDSTDASTLVVLSSRARPGHRGESSGPSMAWLEKAQWITIP